LPEEPLTLADLQSHTDLPAQKFRKCRTIPHGRGQAIVGWTGAQRRLVLRQLPLVEAAWPPGRSPSDSTASPLASNRCTQLTTLRGHRPTSRLLEDMSFPAPPAARRVAGGHIVRYRCGEFPPEVP
jgi:hypothetical protein